MNISNYNTILPSNILRIINEKGLKQGAVAGRAGYSKQQFSDMVNVRKVIKPCDVLMIANALEVTPGELFDTEKGA